MVLLLLLQLPLPLHHQLHAPETTINQKHV
jgi:hypothetical protein